MGNLNSTNMVSETQPSEQFSGHLQDVFTVSVDGSLVATGSRDTTTRLYDRNTGTTLKCFGRGVPRGDLTTIKGRDTAPVLGNTDPTSGGHSADVNAVCVACDRGIVFSGADGMGTR